MKEEDRFPIGQRVQVRLRDDGTVQSEPANDGRRYVQTDHHGYLWLSERQLKPVLAVGDRVRINQHAIPADRRGQRGKIVGAGDAIEWRVEFDDGSQCCFNSTELVKLEESGPTRRAELETELAKLREPIAIPASGTMDDDNPCEADQQVQLSGTCAAIRIDYPDAPKTAPWTNRDQWEQIKAAGDELFRRQTRIAEIEKELSDDDAK